MCRKQGGLPYFWHDGPTDALDSKTPLEPYHWCPLISCRQSDQLMNSGSVRLLSVLAAGDSERGLLCSTLLLQRQTEQLEVHAHNSFKRVLQGISKQWVHLKAYPSIVIPKHASTSIQFKRAAYFWP